MLLALVPAFPLFGFLVLYLSAGRLPRPLIAAVGVGSVGIAAVLALVILAGFLAAPQPQDVTLWTWMAADGFTPGVHFHLDALALVMMLVITFVGFFIHLYSAEFMAGDEGYSRYFASLNLFVAAMLVLVLAGDLLLLYLGWEGVGLCSYLLIGFWYGDPANGAAARKAFIVTRIGDTAMTIGLLLLFTNLGTTDIQGLMQSAAGQWPAGSPLPIATAALLLGGAVGKSAQLPLQTWLPDAMAGPTPVSALIHAATMVTAGVYLIARTHVLYALAPPVQAAVGGVGAATLLLASVSALNQADLKRILAYSTISQIGYMFLALGIGAWSAAIFHFMTHAFFKALLFLSAGVVIQRLREEHDIFRMGGLRHRLRLAFWSFLIGAAALAALPLVTAGFYSKDLILWRAWTVGATGRWLWAAGIVGSLLTGLYIFRAVFVVFFGPLRTQPSGRTGPAVAVPLVVLSALALVGGFVEVPAFLGGVPALSDFLAAVLPSAPEAGGPGAQAALTTAAAIVALLGITIAAGVFRRRLDWLATLARPALRRWWTAGWGFDWLYDRLLVRPYVYIARAGRGDPVDAAFDGLAALARDIHRLLSQSQSGRVRWYAAGIAAGTIITVAITVLA
jgi:NADH-quinone oxidoreductase subunit L